MPNRLSLADTIQYARFHEGECLSPEYINNKTKMAWRCAKGHVWKSRFDTMKNRNGWCPRCANPRRGRRSYLTIEYMRELACKKGGICLSPTYVNAHEKMTWRCCVGHEWKAPYYTVHLGVWCPKCDYKLRGDLKRGNLDDVKRMAEKKGGRCLSNEYHTSIKPLLFECAKGHRWATSVGTMRYNDSWCPTCKEKTNERRCRKILTDMFKMPFDTKRPSWLISTKKGRMELDGYNEELSIAFEYNGMQHYKHVPYYHCRSRSRSLEEIQRCDKEKLALCRNRNVILIVIPYYIKWRNLKDFIIGKLLENGVDVKCAE